MQEHAVYAPPKSDLSHVGDAGKDCDNAFYVVSLRKFTLLFFLTLGTYKIYWFYKNWRCYKERTSDGEIWPLPRAIFSVFFVHSLLYKVDHYATEKQRPLHWKLDTDAIILTSMLIVSNISIRLWDKNIGSPHTGFIWMASNLAMYYSFRRTQRFINISCGDPEGASNSKLGAANWAWLIIGAVLSTMIGIGLMLPDVPP
jgi:hypothetical protein